MVVAEEEVVSQTLAFAIKTRPGEVLVGNIFDRRVNVAAVFHPEGRVL